MKIVRNFKIEPYAHDDSFGIIARIVWCEGVDPDVLLATNGQRAFQLAVANELLDRHAFLSFFKPPHRVTVTNAQGQTAVKTLTLFSPDEVLGLNHHVQTQGVFSREGAYLMITTNDWSRGPVDFISPRPDSNVG